MATTGLPFTEVVAKIFERCNLACKYCYMYELADQSWKERPVRMDTSTFERIVERLADHVRQHQLKSVKFVFHGGEPLMRGHSFIAWGAELLRSALGSTGASVSLRIQTNGTRLDDEALDMLKRQDIKVGISLDGDKVANDRYRTTRSRESSFDEVLAGIHRIVQPEYRSIFRGFYATIDTRNDPVATYDFLQSFSPPMIDFLLPHANWESQPVRFSGESPTSYGDWLSRMFDHWYWKNDPVEMRLFQSIMTCLVGGESEVELVGLTPVRTMFVDSDGTLGQVDTLKSAFEGATDTGLNIFDNSFDDAMVHPAIVRRQLGLDGLSDQCRSCDLVLTCGGGYYPHRYHSDNGFDNPSAYCGDLMMLIQHVATRMRQDVRLRQGLGRPYFTTHDFYASRPERIATNT